MRRTSPVPAVALALLLAGCGGAAEAEGEPSEPVEPVSSAPEAEEPVEEPEPTETAETEPADDAAGGGESAVCDLVSFSKLGAVFGLDNPQPEGTDWGEGFSECVWELDDKQVRVSVVPAANLQSDFVDQLTGTRMAGLEEAVGFDGVVGIGHVSSGGWTTAVPYGDEGLLVGVRSGGSTDDAAVTLEIVEEVLAAG